LNRPEKVEANPYPAGPDKEGECTEVPFVSPNKCESHVLTKAPKINKDCKPKAEKSAEELKSIKYVSADGSALTEAEKATILSNVSGQCWFAGDRAEDKRDYTMNPDVSKCVEEEEAITALWVEILEKLWNFCEESPTHSKDSRWLNLKAKWPRAIVFYDVNFSKFAAQAFFKHVPDQNLTWLGFGRVNNQHYDHAYNPSVKKDHVQILAHEVAHSSQGLHQEQWRNAFLFFSNLFVNDLGYEIEFIFAQCTGYGICNKDLVPNADFQDICKLYEMPGGGMIDTIPVWDRYTI
jgi:hypothetical protein